MQTKTKRITITVPEDLLGAAQRAVDAGAVRSISSYFAAAARESEANETMRQMLDDWTAERGPVPADVADEVDQMWRQAGVDPDAAPAKRVPAKRVPGTKGRKARTAKATRAAAQRQRHAG